MKKLLLSFVLLSISLVVSAENKEVKVLENVLNQTGRPRSVVLKPTVTIDDVTFQLSIKLAASSESFTLFVYDEKGTVIYYDNVLTDGVNHNYMLPTLDYGNYSLVIKGEHVSYEGEFDI